MSVTFLSPAREEVFGEGRKLWCNGLRQINHVKPVVSELRLCCGSCSVGETPDLTRDVSPIPKRLHLFEQLCLFMETSGDIGDGCHVLPVTSSNVVR